MSGDNVRRALDLIRGFAKERISAPEFAAGYTLEWKRLRDHGDLAAIDPYLRRGLNVVFEAIDSVQDPKGGRSLETHADELRVRVATVLSVVELMP